MTSQFNYAETFVIPAAANSYSLKNLGKVRAKVIVCFLKPDWTLASLLQGKPSSQISSGLISYLAHF